MSAARLASALGQIRDGLVPAPPRDAVFVGDGDFLAIAAEFLGYFVEVGGLRPDARILDIGCGIGRMAAAVAPYLDIEGRYLGLDPVAEGIAWCRRAFAGDPRFAFIEADVRNDLYRPDGTERDDDYRLPVSDGSVDFVILTSVFTHMRPPGVARYLEEAARVLAGDGRLFATAYLYDGAAPPRGPAPHLHFDRPAEDEPHCWHVSALPPLAAVAFAADPFRRDAEARMGRPVELRPGRWRGGAGPWFQDLVLA